MRKSRASFWRLLDTAEVGLPLSGVRGGVERSDDTVSLEVRGTGIGRVFEEGEENDAGLPVTQSDDPRSGGHFGVGTSKAPPGPAREGSRIIIHVICALKVADGQHTRLGVEGEYSPIPNGLTTVGGAKTRFFFYEIRHFRHGFLPT